LLPAAALAQQTGTVSGAVFDRSGAMVAGATVSISGDPMPVARATVTSENGLYQFVALLPGTYRLVVEKAGVGRATRTVVVSVALDTQADFLLGSLTEEVTVTATTPDVDLRSAEITFNHKRDFFQDLPLDRSYLGLLQLVPGLADNGSTIGPNGGGARQDNTYLMDGVSITNPLFGHLATEVNELDIVELTVKRGAVSAAFGRSGGFISNAVSRSGTNRLSGNYRLEAIPNEWIKESTKTIRSTTDRWVNSVSAGGPIRPNRAFFYASGRFFRSQSTRSANAFGPLPDRKEHTTELFGKVTAQFGPSHSVNASYRHRPTTVDYAGIGASDSPAVGTNSEGTNRVVSVGYDWFVGPRTTIAVKYLHLDEQGETVAVTDLGFQPPFDATNLPAMGQITVAGITVGGASLRLNRQNFSTDEVKASMSHFFDFGGMGHHVRGGFGWSEGLEDLTRKSNGWGSLGFVTVGGQQRIRATYYPEQPTQYSIGRTYSLFVQDDLTLGSRLTANLGALFNRDDFIQDIPGINLDPSSNVQTGKFMGFGFGDEIQPRLGINYQLRKGQGDKVYANWGRYFALDQKSSARSLASGRLYTENADFNPLTSALISQTPAPNTVAKRIDTNLEPPFMDEIVAGYATPLTDGWSLDVFFQYRDNDDFIEDVPSILPNSTYVYTNDPLADRKYRTFGIELNRSLRDRWSMNVSYAWSRLYGNYDQDYAGRGTSIGEAVIFNTSSLLNDGPGAFTDDRFRQGVLSQDRTHVYKILATWMPAVLDNLSVGVYVRGQSGTPWEARGLPWSSGATYLRYLEPAGTNRNPFWTNVDLLLKYGVRLDARRAVRLEARILNVFDQETALSVDQRKYLDPRNLTIVGTPQAGCRSCYTDAYPQGTNQPNPRYGLPTSYASPTRLLLSILLDF
jgi:hypothetical protein